MSEFDIIRDYFGTQRAHSPSVLLGIGDDAAVIAPFHAFPTDSDVHTTQLVVCVDTLISGTHFPADTSPEDIAYKSLAVNLSDLAAMGAVPKWITLAITLPEFDPVWLQRFSKSLFTLSKQYDVELIGGDTTRGPLSVTIQLMGLGRQPVMTRSGARPGDWLCVTGDLGGASLGLELMQANEQRMNDENQFAALTAQDRSEALLRLNRPEPRVHVGQLIAPYASACIDISDGLLGDCRHLCQASKGIAEIEMSNLPIFAPLIKKVSADIARERAMTFGDDYELLFTVPPHQLAALMERVDGEVLISVIGRFVDEKQVQGPHEQMDELIRLFDEGELVDISGFSKTYDHFQSG